MSFSGVASEPSDREKENRKISLILQGTKSFQDPLTVGKLSRGKTPYKKGSRFELTRKNEKEVFCVKSEEVQQDLM